MTSKERAYLRGLANNLDPIVQIGKNGITPELTESVEEAFNTHELIKLTVLKSCVEEPYDIANILAERTHSEPIVVIGKKLVLYKAFKKNPVIKLP